MSRTIIQKKAIVPIALAFILVATFHPQGQWRVRAVALKLTTEIPDITWTDVLTDFF
jgi:hypothetical protein